MEAESAATSGRIRISKLSLKARTSENVYISGNFENKVCEIDFKLKSSACLWVEYFFIYLNFSLNWKWWTSCSAFRHFQPPDNLHVFILWIAQWSLRMCIGHMMYIYKMLYLQMKPWFIPVEHKEHRCWNWDILSFHGNIFSLWPWWQQHMSKKMEQGNKRLEKELTQIKN